MSQYVVILSLYVYVFLLIFLVLVLFLWRPLILILICQPLQYSRLENPMNGGAWWALVHRVAQSWTQLKQLSSTALKERLSGTDDHFSGVHFS